MATAYGPDTRDREHEGSAPGLGVKTRTKHFLPAPLRAPLEARAWSELLYALLSFPLSTVMFVFAVTMTSLSAGLMVTFIGIPVLAVGLAACRGFGALERHRARALLRVEVADPERVRGKTGGPMSWMGAVLKSGVSWRHLLYTLLHFPWATFTFVVAISFWTYGLAALTYPLWFWLFPMFAGQDGIQLYGDRSHAEYLNSPAELAVTGAVGLVLVMAAPWIVRGLLTVDRLMVTGLLGPSRLATRVSELESDRGVVVDTAAADLRRIERDLHDGAQARLVALAMDLGLAKEKLTDDPEAAARMVDEAHGEVKVALQELRDLARGIHPAVLTDRGLDAALSAIASRCTVPVTVEVDLVSRPAQAIEGIAYFTVSELLQNISKHARATRATVDVWRAGDRLMLQVTDNGRGGASSAAGGGLAGLAERLDAVDGVLVVDSPTGGPTTITAELPWRG
ncbi:sensor domain-containing protein [Streptomyces filamentosus]|uniref:histidine kinase n=2 Tax=Streptomyces filamentosus TaxID=67294 RepID=A0ABY4UWE4_STRFL|nr:MULTISPECIES: sensor histidine kinase [Streptomyces]EFE76844.1 two-component system sensor kinase [Streptomyces filamentosus NRRL 15998]EWS93811.1 two-component system sensor kinase [Streptomyces filamentosus NRRL 11379]MYR80808.1 sensor histidine kinase [Streptomyces sp. SID5466]USC47690.1 sensor domain-containing protein [Streptomyces filamentosus]